MNEEPIFSDRLIPVLALPGVLLSCAAFALDMLDGKPAPSIWMWLVLTAVLGFCSVVVLTIPLYVFAKFKILRLGGLTRAKTVGVMVFGLCLLILATLMYKDAGKLFAWFFEGSRFYQIAALVFGIAFMLFALIYMPYALYRERKERSKLVTLDTTSSRHIEIVEATATASVAIGTKWIKFWTYFSLPVGGILSILGAFAFPTPAYGFLALSCAHFCLAYGLHRRRRWAWQLNWLIIAATWIGGSIPYQFGSTLDFATKFAVAFLLFGAIWMWPNYVYWMKRKVLFS